MICCSIVEFELSFKSYQSQVEYWIIWFDFQTYYYCFNAIETNLVSKKCQDVLFSRRLRNLLRSERMYAEEYGAQKVEEITNLEERKLHQRVKRMF